MVSSTNSPMLNKARNLVKGFAIILIRFLSSMNYLMPIKSWTMTKVLPPSVHLQGFSSVWIHLRWINLEQWIKALPHSVHLSLLCITNMNFQMSSKNGYQINFSTLHIFIRLFSSMNLLMLSEIWVLVKGFATFCTYERLPSCMNFPMSI